MYSSVYGGRLYEVYAALWSTILGMLKSVYELCVALFIWGEMMFYLKR